MKRAIYLLPILAVVLILLFSSLFVVDERQKALVLQFGRVVTIKEDPGLGFKLPLVQEVVYYDDRILSRDIDPIEVTPSDDRRLVVDAFARYRIRNVQDFRQAVGAGGEARADQLVDQILRAELREVLGSVSSDEILSEDRAALMARIAAGAREEALDLGIFILDVRLMRTDLPSQNLAATFARMRAEREREAADEIARGQEAAQRIRAQADRTVIELTSEAAREAEITRGEADARRNSIFATAYTRDPEFFEFYRSLAAYTRALQANNSTLVLSPDSEFFEYLQTDRLPGDLRGRAEALPTVANPEGDGIAGDIVEQSPEAAADDAAAAGNEGAALDEPTERNVVEDEDGTVVITTTSD
ncbi:Modulator of FtsH protease HflC [Jannaschia seosinensis]|uniref:Modulator of FtsH protease HflC n=1 Tax=Jannaschia seosinensis TaxID=313367 RepID=A0A0M7BFZ6_9RHOB|nr:protease modulator HflC [Jannaschia seosinensis]CUH40305.1 Modulator of FtsH protease HflC [Jannaschia seosinensis]